MREKPALAPSAGVITHLPRDPLNPTIKVHRGLQLHLLPSRYDHRLRFCTALHHSSSPTGIYPDRWSRTWSQVIASLPRYKEASTPTPSHNSNEPVKLSNCNFITYHMSQVKMLSDASLVWTKVAPKVWQRGLDENETFWAKVPMLHASGGRKPFELTGHITLRISASTSTSDSTWENVMSSLRKTWQRIRYDHPTIASCVKYNSATNEFYKEYRGICNEEDRQQWFSSTLFHITDYRNGIEFANSDPIAPTLPTLFIVRDDMHGSGTNSTAFKVDLVLRASHDTIDGTGVLLLLGNIIKQLSQALEQGVAYTVPDLDGSESANLSPPYRIAASIPETPDAMLQDKMEKMFSDHTHFGPRAGSGNLPTLALPSKRPWLLASKNQRVEVILERDLLSQTLSACKAIGATVTQVFHAAVPIVIRDIQKKTAEARRYNYVSDLLYNLRGFCDAPYNSAIHPATVYQSGGTKGWRVAMTVPSLTTKLPDPGQRKEEFDYVLEHCRNYYTYMRRNTDLKYLAPCFWQYHLGNLPEVPTHPPPGPAANPAASVSFSSLGKVDDIIPSQVGRINVADPWVTGDEMSNAYGLFLVTHGSRMSLACAYNAAWHDWEDALDFLQRCKTLVLEFLGVSLTTPS